MFSAEERDLKGFIGLHPTPPEETKPAPKREADASKRYPALAFVSSLYKFLAYASLFPGIVTVLVDLQVFDTAADASRSRPLPAQVVAVVAAVEHVLATAFAFVTCLAISEGIRLLLEASDDWHKAASRMS